MAIPRDPLRAATIRPPKGDRDLFPITLGNYEFEVRAQKSAPILRSLYYPMQVRLDDVVTQLWISKSDLIERYVNSFGSLRNVLSHFPKFMISLLAEKVPECTKDRISEDAILKTIQIANQHFNDEHLGRIRKREAARTMLAGEQKAYLLFTRVQKKKDFCIGGGGSKYVKLTLDLLDTRVHAVAICRKEYLSDAPTQWPMAINEVEIHRRLQGIKGILQMVDAVILDDKIYLITERMNQGDLQKVFASKIDLSFKEKTSIGKQIAWGLANLHAARVIHRDLRPENILIDIQHWQKKRAIQACIGDLGSACSLDQADLIKIRTGSKGYLAPEREAAWNDDDAWIKTSTPEADIWCLGLILYSLFHPEMNPLFPPESKVDLTEEALFSEIQKPKFEIYMDDILLRILRINPKERPSAKEVYELLEKCLPPE